MMSVPFGKKRHKFGAKRMSDGMNVYDSKLEHDRYMDLQLMEKGGLIRDLKFKPPKVHLTDAAISYQPDYSYIDTALDELYYEDAKGFVTKRWQIIKKLWKYYGPAPLRITHRLRDGRIVTKKVIVPNE